MPIPRPVVWGGCPLLTACRGKAQVRTISSPAPDLARQIELYWFTKGEKKGCRAFYEILPDCNVKLIFRFSPSGCRMVLLGPLTGRACVEIDGESDYFGVHFRSGQAPGLADVRP